MQPACLLLWAATLSSAKLFVNYDEKLEGRPKVYTVVKEEIGRLDVPSKSSHKNNGSKIPLGIDLKPREALDVLLGKRQTCAQGYGYCPSVLEDAVSRIAFAALMDIAILKDPRAAQLAHVAKAKLAAASATACPREINAAKTSLTVLQAITVIYLRCRTALFAAPTQNTYYWTVTWYYWYYYWTYSIDIQASVVTSTRSTTQTVFSVKTTDAGAASEYFSEKSRTLSLPTPAAATSLESLAGSTSFVSTPSSKSPSSNPAPSSEPSITEMPNAPLDPIPSSDSPDDNASSSSSESRSSSTTSLLRSGGDDGGSPPKSGGSGSSGAKPLWAGSDWKSLWVLALGVGTGVMAAVL